MPLDWERPWQVLFFFLQFLYYLILSVTLLETAACLNRDIGHFLPNEHGLFIERLLCIRLGVLLGCVLPTCISRFL